MSMDQTMYYLKGVNQQFGRAAMKHNSIKVIGDKKSIQGGWKNDDKWNNYPKHLIEVERDWKEPIFNDYKRNPVKDERV